MTGWYENTMNVAIIKALPAAGVIPIAILHALGPLLVFAAIAYFIMQYAKSMRLSVAPLGLDGRRR